MSKNNARLDFEKLRNALDEEGVDIDPTYFFQKSSNLEWSTYRYIVQTLEKLGWNVDTCLDQSMNNTSYSPAMEMSRLLADLFSTACASLEHDDPVEFVLCVNHLSYVPALRRLRERYEFIELTLVCEKPSAHDDLLRTFDTVIDSNDLDLILEGASVPDNAGRRH
jgi:hypothetical protein